MRVGRWVMMAFIHPFFFRVFLCCVSVTEFDTAPLEGSSSIWHCRIFFRLQQVDVLSQQ